MKKIFFSIVILLLVVTSSFAQNANGDKVIGVWLSEKKDARIEIFKTDDKYSGKLIWGVEMYEADGKTPLKDTKNPDVALRTRSRLNLVFISELAYDNGAYIDGHLYDARSGKTYSLKMKLKDDNKLEMRGYYGISLFGQTFTWTRVK
ncbi:DUF2147 domain-containing protein [Mucilaginibacter lappiensis]|uniref:Uncharacterized protein (DUF2147 family) n=1 Tax=Mucilaginibacter lappiensis TaxID=354630 RepID=A0A841JKZ7_9SPHI|nr:DUF2147 domain-containing protein [Mucilaginibacter lappiensis]MBB6129398.1 uncharacterized protein (DUF2147 family) [Mucilaginibacter lappiensis]